MKKIVFVIETLFVPLIYGFFYILPLSWSCGFWAFFLRTIGPFIGVSKTAYKNISMCFPHLSKKEKNALIKSCWDNLGRILGEMPHKKKILQDPNRFVFKNTHVVEGQKKRDQACIFAAAHLGNWELAHAFFIQHNMHLHVISKQSKNPIVEYFLHSSRKSPWISLMTRSSAGGKMLLRAVQSHSWIGMFFDQYVSDGVFIPFFGRLAKTTVALAKIACQKDFPLIPVHVKRIGKASRFEITFENPIVRNELLPPLEQPLDMMEKWNHYLEGWIKEAPHQWLWLHKRWKVKPKDQIAFDEATALL